MTKPWRVILKSAAGITCVGGFLIGSGAVSTIRAAESPYEPCADVWRFCSKTVTCETGSFPDDCTEIYTEWRFKPIWDEN